MFYCEGLEGGELVSRFLCLSVCRSMCVFVRGLRIGVFSGQSVFLTVSFSSPFASFLSARLSPLASPALRALNKRGREEPESESKKKVKTNEMEEPKIFIKILRMFASISYLFNDANTSLLSHIGVSTLFFPHTLLISTAY